MTKGHSVSEQLSRELAGETAEALLNAIKRAAPSANASGSDALKHLADAYVAVLGAMPRGDATGRAL